MKIVTSLFRLTLTTLLFLVVASGQAADLYVASTGSDTNPGTTVSLPFRTVSHAVQVAGPRDVVLIRGGIYREQVDLDQSRCGLPGRPLTIESYKDEQVVLKGSDIVTDWTLDHGAVWKHSGWTINSQQLFADGKLLQQIGAQNPFQTDRVDTNDGSGAPDYRLPAVGKDGADLHTGSFFYDASAHALYCELSDSSDPNKHLMEASVRHTVLTGWGKSYVDVHGLTLMHCNGTSDGDFTGLLQTDGAHWIIDHCIFQYGDFCGVRLSGTDHTVRDCQVLDNGDVGVNMTGTDAAHAYGLWRDRPPQHILLSNLLISGNNIRHFDEGWHCGGIKAVPSVRDVTITGCKVTENNGPGIWFDTDYGDNIVENNFVFKNHTGIAIEINQPHSPDTFGTIVRNNRVIDNGGQGIYISASDGANVVNNTCYGNDFGIVLHGMPRPGANGPYDLRDNVVENNIINGKWDSIVLFDGDGAAHNKLDGNFYYIDSPGGIKLSVTSSSRYDLTAYDIGTAQQKYGFELHGSSGDPMWVDASAFDFRLKPGSPAIGKGWQSPVLNNRK